jgi:hypothetical protein
MIIGPSICGELTLSTIDATRFWESRPMRNMEVTVEVAEMRPAIARPINSLTVMMRVEE